MVTQCGKARTAIRRRLQQQLPGRALKPGAVVLPDTVPANECVLSVLFIPMHFFMPARRLARHGERGSREVPGCGSGWG